MYVCTTQSNDIRCARRDRRGFALYMNPLLTYDRELDSDYTCM